MLCYYLGEVAGDVWLTDISFTPLADPIYRREFTKGLVLLNATGKAAVVNLEPGYARFSGTQAPRWQYLIDDGEEEGFGTTGEWRTASIDSGFGASGGPKPNGPYYHAWNASCRISDAGSGTAEWALNVPEDAEYTIQAWWAAAPDTSKWTSRAIYEVLAGGQVLASAVLHQRTAGEQWHTIAKLRLAAADAPVVRLRAEGGGALVADALHVFSTERLNDGSPAAAVTIGPRDGLLLRRVE
jgi:hypothetical protein